MNIHLYATPGGCVMTCGSHAVSSPFLREMESYMPRPHRDFLTFLRHTSEVRKRRRQFFLFVISSP